jgi:serine/threonine protein kinase
MHAEFMKRKQREFRLEDTLLPLIEPAITTVRDSSKYTLESGELMGSGKFRVDDALYSHTNKTVYLGTQVLGTPRKVVIKLLRHEDDLESEIAIRHLDEIGGERKALHQEARMLELSRDSGVCENIVTILDFGIHSNGQQRPYIVEEFIPGSSLSEVKAYTIVDVLGWLGGIANALAYLHNYNIMHGDLKGGNVRIRPRVDCKAIEYESVITDFGHARKMHDPTVNQKGEEELILEERRGSSFYVAPEVARGARDRERRGGVKSDVYSLGVLAYVLSTGAHPLLGNLTKDYSSELHEEELKEIKTLAVERSCSYRHGKIVDPQERNTGVSPGFSKLIMRMLQNTPSKRPNAVDARATFLKIKHSLMHSDWYKGLSESQQSLYQRRG